MMQLTHHTVHFSASSLLSETHPAEGSPHLHERRRVQGEWLADIEVAKSNLRMFIKHTEDLKA